MTKDALIKRYLLGDLPQDERMRLEEQYFAKTDVFEELVSAENDLIDLYALGELNETEKVLFETQYFTPPQRRARVEFARGLARVCRESTTRIHAGRLSAWRFGLHVFSIRYPSLQWASVAGVVMLAVAGSWLLFQNHCCPAIS